MREILELIIHLIYTTIRLLRPGGVKAVMAENLAMRQQLIALSRGKKRAPELTPLDRLVFALTAMLVPLKRIQRIAILVKPRTILRFHRALVNRKYRNLFSNKSPKKSGRRPPSPETVQLVLEIKRKNPRMGYGRIAMQIFQATGVVISRYAVARILRKNDHTNDPGDNTGPSWLTFIGHMKDSLWSVDLFRCESITLKTHWVMVVIDQFTRRIIGFAVHAGDCDGPAYCRLFNAIRSGHSLPKYLSTDNDPLFLYPRWRANLRILDIEEIKSIPGVPQSHPFIERLIGTVRREFLDHVLFFNANDLTAKLKDYQRYYNHHRAHSSLDSVTPAIASNEAVLASHPAEPQKTKWHSHCRGLFWLPSAA